MTRTTGLHHNLSAFLDMLSISEGTSTVPGSDDGYSVMVGGSLFHSYADHPRIKVSIPRLNIVSTAAGRYQLLARYFDAYKKQLNLPDFSPESQDAIALQQIKERTAIVDIEEGRLSVAIDKCKNIWASLPGAGYGQHEQKLGDLIMAYSKAGGTLS